jgi:hypothetical protein
MTEEMPSETSGEDCANAGCIFCNDLFFSFKSEEGWINCMKCNGWIHETYAGMGKMMMKRNTFVIFIHETGQNPKTFPLNFHSVRNSEYI